MHIKAVEAQIFTLRGAVMVVVPATDTSVVPPSPKDNKPQNTGNQSSSNDANLALEAYRRLLTGDFSEVRAKSGSRQYTSFYSANPEENDWEHTLVDLDSDDIPELFIRLETSPDITSIFHWANDQIIYWEFDTVEATSTYTPLKNGMIWSKYKKSNNIYSVDNSGTFKLELEFTQENKDEA